LEYNAMLAIWQWGLAALAAYLVGLSKTGIAGLGILSVAIFANALPARDSVGIVLVVLIAGDVVAVSTYRSQASWPHLVRLFPWAAIGVVLGALVVGRIDDYAIRMLIGGILVFLVLLHLIRRLRGQPNDATEQAAPHSVVAVITGLSAGFTTMVANAAGPIMVMYLLAMRLPKLIFIGTAAWYFFALNLFKLPFSYSLGLINANSLPISLALIPFAVLGALSGRLIIRLIDQKFFETLAIGLTLIAGLRLLLM
jgi:uncharacterized membrane protein YfcA